MNALDDNMLHPAQADHQGARRTPGSRRGLWWLAPLLLLLPPACAPSHPRPALEDLNVVLIVVDTLSARDVGAYDPALDTTPRIDAFAALNTRFARAYSTAPWTQPSVASIFTSLLPSGHGIQNIRDVLGEDQTTLAELLRRRGFATGGVISHHLLAAELGYGQGFQHYDASAVAGHSGVSSEKVTDLAISRIDDRRGSRFFLFAHYFDPHYEYRHHPEFDRTSGYEGPLVGVDDIWEVLALRPQLEARDIDYLRGRHLEEVAFVDRHVGRLLDHLTEAGLDDSTIVVIVADHGEEFMDHGWIGHTRTLYDELIHVPLIVRIPGWTSPAVVDTPVSTLDILPTLLSLSREAADASGWDGRSWLPNLSGAAPWPDSREILAEVNFWPPSARQQEKLAFKTALIRGGRKIVHDRRSDAWDLYRLDADPGERASISAEEPATATRMRDHLSTWESGRELPDPSDPPAPESLSDEELQRLRSLGYIQ